MTEARTGRVPATRASRAADHRRGRARRCPTRGPSPGGGAGARRERWIAYLEPLPDRLRDDDPWALRATATRCRAAYGVKDSIRDVLPAELTEPFLDSIDRLIRELNRARG